MRFSQQEYWSGLPCCPPEDLPGPGIEPTSLISALAGSSISVIPSGGKQTGIFIHQLLSIRNWRLPLGVWPVIQDTGKADKKSSGSQEKKKKKSSVNKQKMQLLSVASRTTNLKSWGWKYMGGPSKTSSITLFHNSMIRFISFPFYFPKSLIFLNFSKIAPYSFPELNPWHF